MRARALLALTCGWATACGGNGAPVEACDDASLALVVFTRENQWNHTSNSVAAVALLEAGRAMGWRVEATSDPGVFTEARLAATDAIVFSVTSGDVLEGEDRARLEPYFRGGGGFVGTHSASSTEHSWPFYKSSLVAATFWSHPTDPAVRSGTLLNEAPEHPILAGVGATWTLDDEFYSFYERPEELSAHVLLALDETSVANYPPELAVGYHPLAWTDERHGGRSFYMALGHANELYADAQFLRVLVQGIAWAGEPHRARRCAVE